MSGERDFDFDAYYRGLARDEARKVFAEMSSPTSGDSDELLTVPEVARVLHVSAWSVYEMCKRGELPHERTGAGKKLIRIRRSDVLKRCTS